MRVWLSAPRGSANLKHSYGESSGVQCQSMARSEGRSNRVNREATIGRVRVQEVEAMVTGGMNNEG